MLYQNAAILAELNLKVLYFSRSINQNKLSCPRRFPRLFFTQLIREKPCPTTALDILSSNEHPLKLSIATCTLTNPCCIFLNKLQFLIRALCNKHLGLHVSFNWIYAKNEAEVLERCSCLILSFSFMGDCKSSNEIIEMTRATFQAIYQRIKKKKSLLSIIIIAGIPRRLIFE